MTKNFLRLLERTDEIDLIKQTKHCTVKRLTRYLIEIFLSLRAKEAKIAFPRLDQRIFYKNYDICLEEYGINTAAM